MAIICPRGARAGVAGVLNYSIVGKILPLVSVLRMASTSNDDSFYLAPTLAGVRRELQEKKNKGAAADADDDVDGERKETSIVSTTVPVIPPEEAEDRQGHPSLVFIDGLATSHLGLDPRHNVLHAPMVYHERYSCPDWPAKHTFPMSKFSMTAESLLDDPDKLLEGENETSEEQDDASSSSPSRLVLSRTHFYRPLPVETFPKSLMSPPICARFLETFLSGSLSYEESRLIGFREQTSRPELIERTILEVAGTVLTAQLAMKYGLASNLAGGTHHAESDRGKGFTIVNDLAVAARLMTWKEGIADYVGDDGAETIDDDDSLLREFYRGDDQGACVDRVLVVDCDVHQGDGTATFSKPPESATGAVASGANNLHGRLFTLDLHASNNYPHPKETCTYDVGLHDDCDDATYLAALSRSLGAALREVRPQLVLYNAGADIYESDKLGRISVSREGMERRDAHVLNTCLDNGIPVAAVVGGGYDNDARALGRRHAIVHRVCARIWRERRMWTRRPASPKN